MGGILASSYKRPQRNSPSSYHVKTQEETINQEGGSHWMPSLALHCLHAQLCLTLCNPLDCSLPDFSVLGISQARLLEWAPFPPSGDLPYPGVKFSSPESSALHTDSLLLRHHQVCPHLNLGFLSPQSCQN